MRARVYAAACFLVAGAANPEGRPAPKGAPLVLRERTNPQGLSRPHGYSHVVATRGGKMVFVSGQVALDADGNVVGKGDLKAQTEKVFDNLRIALAAAGASSQDVVKITSFVVNYRPASGDVIRDVRARFFGDSGLPASTLVGVQALAREDLLIEVEAIAVVP